MGTGQSDTRQGSPLGQGVAPKARVWSSAQRAARAKFGALYGGKRGLIATQATPHKGA